MENKTIVRVLLDYSDAYENAEHFIVDTSLKNKLISVINKANLEWYDNLEKLENNFENFLSFCLYKIEKAKINAVHTEIDTIDLV
jgi:hypothetical protein